MWMHTVSCVVPHGGKWLALELRVEDDVPGEVQRHVIESFSFVGG